MLNPLSLVSFLAMVAGILGMAWKQVLFSPAPAVIVLQAGAVVLMLWARRTFGLRSFHATANPTSGGIVTNGPYRYIRHPIYTAVCLFVLAGVAGHPGLASAGFALPVFAGAIGRMLSEERLLRQRYPEYAAYASRTARMVPGLF